VVHKAKYSAFESTLNSIVSYRIVSYHIHSTIRVLTVDYAAWGALQQTAYPHQRVSSVVELKRAIVKLGRNAVVHRQKCR